MKYLMIITFALVLNLSALNAAFFSNQTQSTATLSIYTSIEKMDISEASDLYDEPYFCLIHFFCPPWFKSTSPEAIYSFNLHEKVFTLFKPPI